MHQIAKYTYDLKSQGNQWYKGPVIIMGSIIEKTTKPYELNNHANQWINWPSKPMK